MTPVLVLCLLALKVMNHCLDYLLTYFFQPEQPPWMMLYESTVLLTLQILILQGIQEIAEPAHI
jgi:hypothetical protein